MVISCASEEKRKAQISNSRTKQGQGCVPVAQMERVGGGLRPPREKPRGRGKKKEDEGGTKEERVFFAILTPS
jgi:hypothetical protein